MLDFLFENFNFNGVKNFFDIFGGTGIVGVNVKNNYPNIIVTINDYDNKLTKLNYYDVLENQIKFNGYGRASEAAVGAVIKFSKAKVYISFCDDPQSLEWPRKNNFFEALNLRIIYKDKISIHTNNKAKKYKEILITNVKE